MRFWLLAALVAVAWSSLAEATPVYLCERAPGGPLSVTAFTATTDEDRRHEVARLHREAILPDPRGCWFAESADLPPLIRSDPRRPDEGLSQHHRWRRGQGGMVVVDTTVKQPQTLAIQREVEALLPPSRRAFVLATPLGDNLLRAVRQAQWDLVRALLRQIRLRAGSADEVLTRDEVAEIETIGDDYEADFR